MHPFCFMQPSTDCSRPTPTGEGNLLYSVHQFKCWSHLRATSQTHPEVMFNWISEHPNTLAPATQEKDEPSGRNELTLITSKGERSEELEIQHGEWHQRQFRAKENAEIGQNWVKPTGAHCSISGWEFWRPGVFLNLSFPTIPLASPGLHLIKYCWIPRDFYCSYQKSNSICHPLLIGQGACASDLVFLHGSCCCNPFSLISHIDFCDTYIGSVN